MVHDCAISYPSTNFINIPLLLYTILKIIYLATTMVNIEF
jgi:hypothetical protein